MFQGQEIQEESFLLDSSIYFSAEAWNHEKEVKIFGYYAKRS